MPQRRFTKYTRTLYFLSMSQERETLFWEKSNIYHIKNMSWLNGSLLSLIKDKWKEKKKEGKRNKERKKVYKYLTSYNPLQNTLRLAWFWRENMFLKRISNVIFGQSLYCKNVSLLGDWVLGYTLNWSRWFFSISQYPKNSHLSNLATHETTCVS